MNDKSIIAACRFAKALQMDFIPTFVPCKDDTPAAEMPEIATAAM